MWNWINLLDLRTSNPDDMKPGIIKTGKYGFRWLDPFEGEVDGDADIVL
jgi:hypothetical protein